jgi:hemerythrin-like domain-containing protein
MKIQAITLIKEEHWALSAVLQALALLVRRMRARIADGLEPAPDFALLKAVLDYIVSYPDRWHHPKEDEVLFPAVRKRTNEAEALLRQLEAEHVEGAALLARLQTQLMAFRDGAPSAREAFFDAVDAYTKFQWEHIAKEEEVLLPLARRVLTAEDWHQVALAFDAKDNPPFGIRPREQASTLYRRILEIAPPPMGYRTDAER